VAERSSFSNKLLHGGLRLRTKKSRVCYGMKFFVALGLMALPLFAGTVDDFRWKKRLLVVTGNSEGVKSKLAGEKEGLEERDVVVFFLDRKAGDGTQPDAKLERELRQRLKTRASVSEVFLLGKDGRTTLRWKSEEFTAKDLFGKIDVMPMRKDEAKKAGG
jgi:hypothetical protein